MKMKNKFFIMVINKLWLIKLNERHTQTLANWFFIKTDIFLNYGIAINKSAQNCTHL